MYTQPIADITFADVEAFVNEKNRESIILDYKEAWPTDLEKVMAAMANTQGGLVLIGVAEDGKMGVPRGIVGVDVGTGADSLRQRVVSTAYKAIYPPVLPEVAVVSLVTDPTRAVVVVRLSPSTRVPHAIDNRRRIYVRVDSQSEPHNLATLDQLEWLWDRRRRAQEARDGLIRAAEERAQWILEPPVGDRVPTVRGWVAPQFYAGEQVWSLNEVRDVLRVNAVRSNVQRGFWSFPHLAHNLRSVPSGFCTYLPWEGAPRHEAEYVELGTSSLLFAELHWYKTNEGTTRNQLHLLRMLSHIDGMLKFADQVYSDRVWGVVQVQASLHHVQGVELVAGSPWVDDYSRIRSPNKVVSVLQETLDRQALKDSRPDLIRQAARSITWAFGYSWDEEVFERGFGQWYSA